jgi:hypothetical protein
LAGAQHDLGATADELQRLAKIIFDTEPWQPRKRFVLLICQEIRKKLAVIKRPALPNKGTKPGRPDNEQVVMETTAR